MKGIADSKLNIATTMSGKNCRGKGENAGYQHLPFYLFLTVFSKAFFFRVVKSLDCGVRVKTIFYVTELLGSKSKNT